MGELCCMLDFTFKFTETKYCDAYCCTIIFSIVILEVNLMQRFYEAPKLIVVPVKMKQKWVGFKTILSLINVLVWYFLLPPTRAEIGCCQKSSDASWLLVITLPTI